MSEENEINDDELILAEIVEMPTFSEIEVTQLETAFDMATIGHMLSLILANVEELSQWKRDVEKELEKFQQTINEGGMLSAMMKMFK
jgi:hypothetical protein